MYHIYFYVPESHLEPVKDAMFAAGAGAIAPYSRCCWQTRGTGQYQPEAGSNPYQGSKGQVESAPEYKVELVCQDQVVSEVVAALKNTHPYETVAYGVFKLVDL